MDNHGVAPSAGKSDGDLQPADTTTLKRSLMNSLSEEAVFFFFFSLIVERIRRWRFSCSDLLHREVEENFFAFSLPGVGCSNGLFQKKNNQRAYGSGRGSGRLAMQTLRRASRRLGLYPESERRPIDQAQIAPLQFGCLPTDC